MRARTILSLSLANFVDLDHPSDLSRVAEHIRLSSLCRVGLDELQFLCSRPSICTIDAHDDFGAHEGG